MSAIGTERVTRKQWPVGLKSGGRSPDDGVGLHAGTAGQREEMSFSLRQHPRAPPGLSQTSPFITREAGWGLWASTQKDREHPGGWRVGSSVLDHRVKRTAIGPHHETAVSLERDTSEVADFAVAQKWCSNKNSKTIYVLMLTKYWANCLSVWIMLSFLLLLLRKSSHTRNALQFRHYVDF